MHWHVVKTTLDLPGKCWEVSDILRECSSKMIRNIWMTFGKFIISLGRRTNSSESTVVLRDFWIVQKRAFSFSQMALSSLVVLSVGSKNVERYFSFLLTDSLATWHHHQTWNAPRYFYQSCSKLVRVLRGCGHHVSFPIIHRAVTADPDWGLAHGNTGQWCAVRTGRTQFKPVLLYNGTWFTGKTGN